MRSVVHSGYIAKLRALLKLNSEGYQPKMSKTFSPEEVNRFINEAPDEIYLATKVSGVGLIIAGSLLLSDVGEFAHFLESRILAPPVVLIVAGCIVFLVASLGCYGAIRESYYMLMAFALCLLIIFIIEFAVGIAAATYKSEIQTVLKDAMTNSMNNYATSKADKVAWDNIQNKLECCGVDGPIDWTTRPVSCCHPTRENAPDPTPEHCKDAKPGDDFLYSYGCFDELQMKAQNSAKVLIGVGIGVAFIEIIGIILACWMASAIKNKD